MEAIMKNEPIPYAVTDLPVPYRVRVLTASAELRAYVVPRSSVATAEEPKSETRLKVA
jgi:hypothetical protein